MTDKVTKAVTRTLLLVTSCCLASQAASHHSAIITYDMDQVVELEGEVTDIVWRNPHVRFTLA
ncbi:MAG: DUF6152 family protein, partial [Pseudomonadota bacterium]|nr:DUF6152 family protein [Pseudomonadota bacterium]